MLDFPQLDGLRRKVQVLAARTSRVDDGDVLHLWVALPADEVAEEPEDFDADDDEAGDADDGLESKF
jgi:hypothetical protein